MNLEVIVTFVTPPDVNGLSFTMPDPSLAADQFLCDRFVYLPGFLPSDEAAWLLSTTDGIPAKSVQCGLPDVRWGEQQFDAGHPAYELFVSSRVIDFIGRLTGMINLHGLEVWTSCYAPGQFINAHRDGRGTIQLLINLRAPSDASHGGRLHVDGTELFLTPGDAVAFKATELEHYTSPATEHRVVLVGRYFMQ
jgi:hypothetical protein